MITEGKIIVDMKADGTVYLVSNRTESVANLLLGRRPAEVLELLPLVFSLCAKAHLAAARAAMGQEQKREDFLLVLAKNAREHLLRIMLGWRLDEDNIHMPVRPVMALVSSMEAAAGNGSETKVANAVSDYLQTYVLGCTCETFLRIHNIAKFHEWLRTATTGTSRYLLGITEKNWQGLGAVVADYLPNMPNADLQERLALTGFAQHPDWLGSPCETGPLTRQNAHPLVAEIVRKHGAGLLARMVARLVDLTQIPQQMQQDLERDELLSGLGIIETARGRLIHSARLEGGVVTEYRIIAPTEWNFYTRGVVAQSLATLPAADKGIRLRQACAVIEAIDPCVDFELRVA